MNKFKYWLNAHKDMILPTVFSGIVVLLLWSIFTFIYEWAVLNIPLLLSSISTSDFSSWRDTLELWGQETVTIEQSNFQIINLIMMFLCAFVLITSRFFKKKHELVSKYLKREKVYADIISKLAKKDDTNEPSDK
jgi:hypothetical protein